MTDPENHTLRLLREIRSSIEALGLKVDQNQVDQARKFDQVIDRLESLRQAAFGESVLGRYAAAEVEERLAAIERRLAMLEGRG